MPPEEEYCFYCNVELVDSDRRPNGRFVRVPYNGEPLCRQCASGKCLNDQRARDLDKNWEERVRNGDI